MKNRYNIKIYLIKKYMWYVGEFVVKQFYLMCFYQKPIIGPVFKVNGTTTINLEWQKKLICI